MEIDLKLLATLVRDSYKLFCLESEGVQDWSKYKRALSSKDCSDSPSYYEYANKEDAEVIALFLNGIQAVENK